MKVSNIVLFSSVILLPVLYCDVPNNEEGNLKEEAPSRIVGSGRKHISTPDTEDLDEINLSREPATNEEAKLPQLEPDGVNNTELEEQKNNASVEKNPFPPPNAPLSSPHEAHGGMNEDAKLPEIASNSSNNSNQKGNSLPIDTFSGHNDKSEGEIHDKNNEFPNSKNDEKEDRKNMSQSELQDDGVNNLSREALTNTEAEKDKNAEESLLQVESEHPLETQPTHTESKPQDKITNNKTEESPKNSKIDDENSDLPNSTKNGIKNFNNVRKKLTQIFEKFKRKKPKRNQTEDDQKEDAKINKSNNEGIKADPENNMFSELPQKSNSVGRENLVNAESSENPPTNKGQPPQEDEVNEESPAVSKNEDGDDTQGADNAEKGDTKINSSNEEVNASPENDTFSKLSQEPEIVNAGENFNNTKNIESSETLSTNKSHLPQEDEIDEESPTINKNEDGDDTPSAENAEKGDAKINNSSNEEINASPENDTFSKLSQKPENVSGENFNNTNIESSETSSTNKSQPPQEDEINEESPTINKNEDDDGTQKADNAKKEDAKINNSSNEEINTSPENDKFSKLSQESDNVNRENFNNTNIESSETSSINKSQPPQKDEVNEESPTVNKNEDGDDTPSADNLQKEKSSNEEINASLENNKFSELSQKPDNVSGENFNNTNIVDKSSETSPLNKSQLLQENEINKESPGVGESENGDNNPSADNADKEDATINDHSNEVNSNPENNTISETPPKSKNDDEKNLSNTNIKFTETPPKSKSQPLWEDEISEESPTVDENDDVDNLSANNATPEENSQNKGTDILSKSLSNKNETNDNESGDIMSKEKENIAGEDDPKNAPAKGIPEENSDIQTRSSIGENGNENNSTLNQSDNLEEIEDKTDEDPTDEEIETENNDEENLSNNFTPDEDIYEELLPKINTETNSKIQSEKNSDDEIESEENLSVFDDVYETDDDGDSQEADKMPQGNEETKSEEVEDENEDNYLEPPHASKENDSKYLDNGNNDPSKMKESQEVNKKTITNEIEPANSDSKVEHLDEDSSLVGSLKGKEDEDRVSEELASEKDTKISNRDVGEEQPLQIENNLNGVLQNGTRNIKPEHENNNSLPLDTFESEPTEKYDNDQDENPTVISPEMDESRENETEDLNASNNTPMLGTNEEEKPKVTVGNTSNNTESGTTLGTSKTDNEMRSEEISEQIDSSESSETSSSNKQENNTPIIKQQIKISPFIYKSIFVSYFSPALQRHLTNRMQITKAQRPPTNNNEALQETANGTPSPKPDSELNADMSNSTQNDSMSSSNENDSVELGTWNRALLKDDDDDDDDDNFSQEESKYLPSESNENTEKDHIPEHPITTSLPSVIQSRSNSSLKEGDLSDADTKVVPEEMSRANLPINEENNSAEISNTSDADPSTVEELPHNFTKNKVKRNQLLPKIQEKPKRDSSNKDTPATPEKTNKNNLSLEEMIDDPIESSETVDEDSPLFGESPKNIPKNRPKPKEKILPSNPQRKSPANAHNPCKKSPKQSPLKNKSQPQLSSGSNNAPSTSDLVPKNINSTGPSDENKPPEESEKSEELGQPTWETEENDSQANDDNYPEEIIENELSKEDDESPPETQKKAQSNEPNFMRPVSPSIPPRRKNNFLRKKRSKIARPQLPSRSNNAPSTSDLVPKNTDSAGPSDENNPPEESEESEELGQPTVEMEENDSQANDNNYPEEIIENELSKEDDESPPETQKKTQSAEPNSVRPLSPSIPSRRKKNFPRKKKSKIARSQLPSGSNNTPSTSDLVPKNTDSTGPSDENKPPEEPEESEGLGQPTLETEENDSQANDDNYPEEIIENELSKEDDESPPETQKKTQSAEPNSVRPVSPSIPPQRKNNFPQKKKTKIPKSKSSNSENKPLAREFVYRATPNKFQEAGKTKEPNLPTSKLRSETPQATNDDSFEDDLPEDDSPENVSPPNENTSKDTQKNATNTFPSDNNVYLREMPQPDREEMSVETRDNEPENTTPKNDSPQTETTEDESESETSSTEGGNELPAINGGNNPVKFNPLQGMAVNPFSSYFPPLFSPFMRSFNQPPMAQQTNEGTASVPPARISNPPPTPPQPSNEEDDITEEEPSSEVESLENRDEEDPIISDHDNVEQKPEPANVPPPVYKSMTVSFLSPTTSKQQPIVRSSSYFSMGTGDNPFWSAMQRIVGIGVKNAGALIEGAGKVSEAGFDATKDVFDMVKKVPVVRDVISPVKKFAENGLDVADQTVTGSLLSIGSYVNDQGQTTRQRSLGQLGPDRYRYRYQYPNSDESNNDSVTEKQQSAPSSLWSFGKFAMNGPTTQNAQGRSLNNPMPYYSRYRYSNNWK